MYNTTAALKCTDRNSNISSTTAGSMQNHCQNRSLFEDVLCQLDGIRVLENDTLRVKVTNECSFSCKFCHREGSIKSGNLALNTASIYGFTRLHKELKLTQAHLTGGEPTSYPHCRELIGELKSIGYRVKMTTNGQFEPDLIRRLKDAGLDGMNFSIHTFDAQKLCSLQRREKNIEWGLQALRQQLENVHMAQESGMEVKINTVVQKDADIYDVLRISDYCKNTGIGFRILNDLGQGASSIQQIDVILKSMNANVENINIINKSSGGFLNMVAKDGFKFKVKCIRKNMLETLCGKCKERDECMEWFYGIRVEQANGGAMVRLCIQRQDYPAMQTFEEFFTSRQFMELM
ncbi:MAG: radical SAM protein [Candidatus Kuenenia sp.]|nr:radical SAM protein [Candidatus Kuenenia hertensis]